MRFWGSNGKAKGLTFVAVLLLLLFMTVFTFSGCNAEIFGIGGTSSAVSKISSKKVKTKTTSSKKSLKSSSETEKGGEYQENKRYSFDEYEEDESFENDAESDNTDNADDFEGIFITPTGKKYHFKRSCAGKNAIETTLEEAIEKTEGPCKKCAGG